MGLLRDRLAVVLCLSALAAAAPAALAGPGAELAIGKFDAPVAVRDTATGATYNLFIEAREKDPGGGGDLTLLISDSPANLCSVHGPTPESLAGSAFAYGSGNEDYAFECGTAYGQTVSINGCKATVQAHGFVHQDRPLTNFLGMTTIDVALSKANGVYKVNIRYWTPGGVRKIAGSLPPGAYRQWASCP
ncbi:hypothetical protein DK847_00705 [Aestuariivirga litoralis]|uniref:Uncharacterized protein n=1 Tax=Aestuariivirga litoralis TaxID=2650924 RepID=A0A2W2BY45_9HYPH|nr:hypothetical protein [Aestuariivirga litoralis]PZF78376.1 hypothetical protein DK847_00705 [Aestuariivirga litoralis]